MKLPGRNEPCWCGSGKKYKQCHLDSDARGETAPPALLAEQEEESRRAANRIMPGRISPERPVPPEIVRPPYVGGTRPKGRSCLKRPEEIPAMRAACAAARKVLDAVVLAAKAGVTTDELDRVAHEETIKLGAYPSCLKYCGYPKSICTSLNEVICHGIPDDRPLKDGDILNCDMTVYLNGYHGDCNETIFIGKPDAESLKLVRCAYDCMMAGIEAVRPGRNFNVIGSAIEARAEKDHFSVVRDYTGHGIGADFHMSPAVFHYFDRYSRAIIEEGMTFTVEPMINVGTWRCKIWNDQWTTVTADLKRSAQFEHTLLVTKNGAEILTGSDQTPYFKKQLKEWGL